MKRTNATIHLVPLAISLWAVRCGGSDSLAVDASEESSSGAEAGSGLGDSGGLGPAESGTDHPCPGQRPVDTSACSGRSTCSYPDGVCNCIQAEVQDTSLREWNCVDTVRDVCPKVAPKDGEMCLIVGLKCSSGNHGGSCSCVAEDGSVQWHC